MTDGCDISSKIALRWTPLGLSDDESTLVQAMAWCRQATSHYLHKFWPRSLPPYGVTRLKWVKVNHYLKNELVQNLYAENVWHMNIYLKNELVQNLYAENVWHMNITKQIVIRFFMSFMWFLSLQNCIVCLVPDLEANSVVPELTTKDSEHCWWSPFTCY